MTIAGVAWRNVYRNKRRTALNVLALTVGISILIVALGWIGGYHTYIYQAVINFETGHLQVLREGYYQEKRRLPVDMVVPDYPALRDRIEETPGVIAAAGRVPFSVTVSNGRDSVRLMGRGVDPTREREVGVLDDQIVAGSYFEEGTGVLIGRPLADKLNVAPGDSVFLRAVDRHGVENLVDAKVSGVFFFGYPALDDNVVYMDLQSTQDLLALEGEVAKIIVRLEGNPTATIDTEAVERAVAQWASNEPDPAPPLEVRVWKDFARTAVSAVQGDTMSFVLMMIIVYFLIVIGILNSMSMSVHERTREIGSIRAIGMTRGNVLTLFTLESIWMGLIAVGLSLIITTPLAVWLQTGGIDIGQYLPEDLPVPFGERFYADFAVWHYLVSIISGVLAGILGGIRPARRAAKVQVADAMRGMNT